MKKSMFHLVALSLVVPILLFGCGSGSDGAPGAAAPTTGTISGTVQDNTTGTPVPLSGVEVYTSATPGGTPMAAVFTDASGNYTISAPIGGCYVYFEKDGYTAPGGMYVGVGGGLTTTVSATMNAINHGPSVSIAAVTGDNFGFGAIVTLAASGSDPDGDTLTYSWSNATSPAIGSVAKDSSDTTGRTGKVTLATMTQAFSRRPVSSGADISGYVIPARFGVMPIFPDTRGTVSARVTVSDGRGGTVSATLALNAASIVAGLKTVPVNTRIYMNRGNDNATQTWTLTKPDGSAAALDNDASRTPSFLADVAGTYTLSAGGKSATIYAGTWEGVIAGAVGTSDYTVQSSCITCHNGGSAWPLAPDMFTPWKGTNHATLYIRNITIPEDQGGDPEGKTCQYCHTVGYDAGTSNGGFDDAVNAYNSSWIPPVPYANAWADLFASTGLAAIAKLANIQCENCHGPQNSLGHTRSDKTLDNVYLSPRVSFSAEVCATCHGRTSHNYYSQWATPNSGGFGHSNRSRAAASGTSTSCGRCHGAQGFVLFVDRLKAGYITLATGTLTGVSGANIEPVTCTACHDPHDKTNPHQLRVYNNTALLPSGFRVTGFGKGALCVTCHNTRNGAQASPNQNTKTYLHEDGETYNGGNPTGYSAPHTASQGDVVAGRNAYFMGASLPMVSKHAAVEDACVGCHMALNPKTMISHGASVPRTHLFRIEPADEMALCANCHGSLVNGEATKAAIEAGLESLQHKMGEAAKLKINDTTINGGVRWVRAYNASTDLYSSSDPAGDPVAPSNVTFDVDTNPVTHVEIVEGHGQVEFHITLTTPIDITWTDGTTTNTNEFGVQLGSLQLNNTTTAANQIPLYGVQTADGPRPGISNMVRAGWNYFLIEGDGSEGLHNPSFAQAVLNATLAQDLSY